jgi:hypothetical protein
VLLLCVVLFILPTVLAVELVRDNLFQHLLVRQSLDGGLTDCYGEQALHEKCS